MIAIDLSKQQELDANPKDIQPINFTWNLIRTITMFFIIEEAKENILKVIQPINFTANINGNITVFFIIEEAKENILDFSQGTIKVL